jgi:hypothetical protein
MTDIAYAFELKNDLSELDRLCQKCESIGDAIGIPKKLIF